MVHLLSHLSVCELERPSGTGDWLVFTRGSKSPKGKTKSVPPAV